MRRGLHFVLSQLLTGGRVSFSVNVDRWFWIAGGQDLFRADGWFLSLGLVPQRQFARRGYLTPVGWRMDLRVLHPAGPRWSSRSRRRMGPSRWPLHLSFGSDADHIATMLARKGQGA